MFFWVIAILLAIVAAGLLVFPLWRTPVDGPGATDIDVYRDQLAEVDRDLARGVLAADEAERTRTEIARRILAADKTAGPVLRDGPAIGRPLSIAIAGMVVAATAAIYWSLGAPGYDNLGQADRIARGDAMRDNRPTQAQAEAAAPQMPTPEVAADYLAMVEQLRAIVPTRPDDPQGWELLARQEATLGNFTAAIAAQTHLIGLRGTPPPLTDQTFLADLMVAAADGIISPETEVLLRDILARDAKNISARYYIGLLYAQTDRPDIAFRLWRDIVTEGPADNPHVQFARGQVQIAAEAAGTDYTLPAERGPTAADIAAAAEMPGMDRDAMIRGMVAQLSDRLARQGGTAAEWAQLIVAYGVLGETEQARAIWTEAQTVFAADATAMNTISAAATEAGLTP